MHGRSKKTGQETVRQQPLHRASKASTSCHTCVTSHSQAGNSALGECAARKSHKEGHMLLADMESENLIITSQVLAAAKHQYTVELARSSEDILEAQRLRYRVFAEEMGANLKPRIPGVDSDIYDPYCEHLIVRDE